MARPRKEDGAKYDHAIRVPIGMLRRIDWWAEKKREAMPGFEVSRNECVRALLLLALKTEGVPEVPPAPAPRGGAIGSQ